MMQRAIVKITKEALEDFLPLPKGTRVVEVLPDDRRAFCTHEVEFVVEHDDFVELNEGDLMPHVILELQERPIDLGVDKAYDFKWHI